MTSTLNISSLVSGGLITNYYCSSSCRHCLYRCSPLWPKNFIDVTLAEKQFSIMKKLGCNAIHIGGGEPLLNPDGLFPVLDQAKKSGIKIDYIETNSSWFQKTDNACELLHEIANRGVNAVLISISPFHNEYVPFYKVKGVIDSCKKTGIFVNAWTWDFYEEINSLNDKDPHTLDEFTSYFGDNYIAEIPFRYWISPGGRALETFGKLKRGLPIPSLLSRFKGGCPELSYVNHFHFDLYGNYIPGLCAGISIRADDIGAPLDEHQYPILTILHTKGIEGLFRFAMQDYGFEPSKALYYTKCELCFEIRKFLVCSCGIISKELNPIEHYTLNSSHE